MTASNIDEFEMALLANLMPETAEEAMTLVPSLKVRPAGMPCSSIAANGADHRVGVAANRITGLPGASNKGFFNA